MMDAGHAAAPTLSREGPRDELRFGFGRNWRAFLGVLDAKRIAEAEASLRSMLGLETLASKTFVDVGCGSGLFSLAAMRLHAARVHSFDYDPDSVACGRGLKDRFFPAAEHWSIERGSALDPVYLKGLGLWDVVYSWGVLHHTGRMWEGLANAAALVAPSGVLFVSIYNDQGWISRCWARVKRFYNRGPLQRAAVLIVFIPYFAARGFVADLLRLRNPARRYTAYARSRGMSLLHDWIDWIGGYPFEVATPEAIVRFLLPQGFVLANLRTCGGGHGCNEFVFHRAPPPPRTVGA
jgi:2-polyprenyl-6-hydroxyphenyl methylase/3-demethylubiquinone-9 3-methyltransferase